MSRRSDFNSSLRRHDSLDVAAGCGALLLLPPNTDPTRLLALSAHALRSPSTPTQRIQISDWTLWLRDSPSLHSGPPWDPPEGLFAQPAQFFGGGYTMVPRGEAHSVFDLQSVLDVIAIRDWPNSSRPLREGTFKLAIAALRISHLAATRAGLRRYEHVDPVGGLVLPRGSAMDELTAAVTFDEETIRELTDDAPEVLDPLVHDLRAGPLPDAQWPFDLTPLLRRGDRYVLCDPAALVLGLLHRLILMAIDAGEGGALADRLGEYAATRVRRYCERMDWTFLQGFGRTDGVPLKQLTFGFDLDKACNVIVVYDNLSAFDPGDPEGPWNASAHLDEVLEQMRDAEAGLMMGPGSRPNEILHLVVLAGIGRTSRFGMPALDTGVGSAQKLLSLEALDTLTTVGADSLSLYKCARAGERLRGHAQVVAFTPLDEYAAWKENDDSFYFGDDVRPTLVIFEGDHGRAMREDAAARADVHPARTVRGTTAPVVRLVRDVPIYAQIHELDGPPRLLVEGEEHRFWVIGPETYARPSHRATYARLIDAIAYWLWQFEPSLAGQPGDDDTMIIEVRVDDPEVWERDTPLPAAGREADADVDQDGRVVVRVHDAMVGTLYQANNEAERELMRALLVALGETWAADGGSGMTPEQVYAAVEVHAPLGAKKKINVFTISQSPALHPDRLPKYRAVQPADSSDILDELGPELQRRLKLKIGPIPDEDRVDVLRATVDIHFEELARLVATLSPQMLLEQLLSLNEAIVHHGEVDSRTLGARIACYGETGMLEELREALPKSNAAAIASRFLIEYVAASPPAGVRPLSLALYDRLLALASEITSRGMASDAVYYKLDDSKLSILGSGRLGQSRDEGYYTGQHAFLDAAVPTQVRGAARSYASTWDEKPVDRPDFALQLDAACMDEFGMTMTELVDLHTELVALAWECAEGAPASMARADLEAELAQRLGWAAERVPAAIDLLALGPRPDLLRPPVPFKPYDTYPWRFNRALSYLRRPLLLRTEGREVVWAMRHTDLAGHYLLRLVLSERYRASAPALKQLMTELRQRETTAFNEHVASLCEQAGMIVKRNVGKVGKLHLARENGQSIKDIDVLAADTGTRTLHVLESKDLEGARTPAELSNEIAKTFGTGGKKASAAEKHIERIDWVRKHLAQTLSWLGIDNDPANWTIAGRMVVDTPVMSPYIARCPLPVLTADQLAEELDVGSPPQAQD
jgi:hypothetical protein